MLQRVEFDPFEGASPEDVLVAHTLLSDARNVTPKESLEDALEDLARYKLFTHGTRQRSPGFSFYKDEEGNVVGMAYTTEFSQSSTLKLEALAVVEAHRGEGCGAEILDNVIETAKHRALGTISLAVRTDNQKARQLYVSRDFEVTDRSGRYEEMLLKVA